METLRPAEERDFPAIRALIHSNHLNPTGLDWRRFAVVVDEGGQVLACAQVKPHGQARELASLAVLPEQRGRGLARRLVEHWLERTPRPLYLMCRPELESLYARFGFRAARAGELPGYFRRILRLFALLRWLGARGGPLVMVIEA